MSGPCERGLFWALLATGALAATAGSLAADEPDPAGKPPWLLAPVTAATPLVPPANEAKPLVMPVTEPNGSSRMPAPRNDGVWSIGDGAGRVVARGAFRNGKRQGKWV